VPIVPIQASSAIAATVGNSGFVYKVDGLYSISSKISPSVTTVILPISEKDVWTNLKGSDQANTSRQLQLMFWYEV